MEQNKSIHTTIIEQLPEGWTRKSRSLRLQELAQRLFGTQIEHKSSGEPYLVGEPIFQISISHTADLLAFSYSHVRRCGVDIELVSRRTEHLSRKFATARELEVATQVFRDNPSLLIWCAKEALYKYMGQEGVDFLKDMELLSATSATLEARGRGEIVEMEWRVEAKYNLLIVSVI